MTNEKRYFKANYFQKSRLLFALIADLQLDDYEDILLNTYLFSDSLDENIYDYYLLCEFKKDFELTPNLNKYLTNIYTTTENTLLYVFHIIDYKVDVDKFLEGKYTEFTEDSINKIMYYYYVYEKNPKTGKILKLSTYSLKEFKKGTLAMHVFFYPKEYRQEIADEMINFIYETRMEALEVLQDMNEILDIYDKEKETFTKEIKT